jgi:hypothetical protein
MMGMRPVALNTTMMSDIGSQRPTSERGSVISTTRIRGGGDFDDLDQKESKIKEL